MKNKKKIVSAILPVSAISGIIYDYFSIKEFGYFINVADLLLIFIFFLIFSEFKRNNSNDDAENNRDKKKNNGDDDTHGKLG